LPSFEHHFNGREKEKAAEKIIALFEVYRMEGDKRSEESVILCY